MMDEIILGVLENTLVYRVYYTRHKIEENRRSIFSFGTVQVFRDTLEDSIQTRYPWIFVPQTLSLPVDPKDWALVHLPEIDEQWVSGFLVEQKNIWLMEWDSNTKNWRTLNQLFK